MNEKQTIAIEASTDGACSGNPGPGGWAGLIRFEDGSTEEFGGFEKQTTNNRMELKAALQTLEKLKTIPRKPNFKIKTDSKYLINGLSEWIKNWKIKGWITSTGKPVLNKDLWQALDAARLDDVSMEYVKGHSGDTDNERVDKIAVSYSKGLQQTSIHSHQSSFIKNKNTSVINSFPGKIINSDLESINNLLTQLDLIKKLAESGHGLTSRELSDLLQMNEEEIRQKKIMWEWREWSIKPIHNGLWKICFKKNSQKNTRAKKNV